MGLPPVRGRVVRVKRRRTNFSIGSLDPPQFRFAWAECRVGSIALVRPRGDDFRSDLVSGRLQRRSERLKRVITAFRSAGRLLLVYPFEPTTRDAA